MTRDMKDSGIEWIGKIPKEWEIVPAKSMFVQRNGKGNKCVLQLLSPTQKFGVIPQSLYEEKTGQNAVKLDEKTDLSALKTMHKGDYCISLRSFQGGFELSEYEGVVSPAYQVFYPIKAISQRYYKHLFKTQRFIDEMISYTMSLRDGKNIAFADFGKSYIPVPPLSEQKRIGNYLDFKCSQIDRLSDNIKQQIEELGEYKKALITQAVTKGLDPDVEMKDSGVEWVGVIPADWSLIRMGYITTIKGRLGWKGLKADEYVKEGIPFLSAFNIVNQKADYSSLNFITEQRYEESPEIKLRNGQILLVKDGAGIGKCCYLDTLPGNKATVNSSLAVITTNEQLLPKYLYYYLNSQAFTNTIMPILNGMGVPHLTQGILNHVKIAVPPISMQNQIVKHLDVLVDGIEGIVTCLKEEIKCLGDYKKSLIYDYVTGKREVPVSYRKDGSHE